MFLFHWCLNAIRCRRDTTLEAMPLSPTKYNGLPPTIDCSGIQRQLVDDIPTSGYDIAGSLLDDYTISLLQDRSNKLGDGDESRAVPTSTRLSTSRDSRHVTEVGCVRSQNTDEPLTQELLATQHFSNRTAGYCGGEHDHDNAAQVTFGSDKNNSSVLSCTNFSMTSSQLDQTELQRENSGSDKDVPFVTNNDVPRNIQVTGDVSFHEANTPRRSALETSHRNAAALFPVDTVQDPLVTIATSLVNFAFNAAVRILDDNVTTAAPDPTRADEVDVMPVSVEPSVENFEPDPVEAAASRLVSQVLSEIARKNSSSVAACSKTVSITTSTCDAPSLQYAFVPCTESCCESDPTLQTSDNDAAAHTITSVLKPAGAENDCLSEGDAGICSANDQTRPLVASLQLVGLETGCESVCTPSDEYALLPNDGAQTLISTDSSQVLQLFADTISADDVDSAVGLSNAVDNVYPSYYDDSQRIDSDAQAWVMFSKTTTERDVNSPGDRDNAPKQCVENWAQDDDSYSDARPSAFASTNQVGDALNAYYESNCRPEDYFFHRYVIPVDQLEAGEGTPMTDSGSEEIRGERGEQRSKMQLDLNSDAETNETDADIEAVAAFCRAMFTPVEIDVDDNNEVMLMCDVEGSPDTLETEDLIRVGRSAGVRRCISLRTSPGTPHKKKSVRFADALGLDLECVRQIQTSIDDPTIVPAACGSSDDEFRCRRPLLAEASAAWRRSRPPVRRYLCACFQAPGSHPDFVDRVRRSRVVLESCENDDRAMTLSGLVRVANVAFHKIVAARVTTDGWTTQTDVAAEYVPRSNDGTTDRFSFQIMLPRGATDLGRRVELAVYFTAFFDVDGRSETYWDNNFGANYCFECYANDDGGTATLDTDVDNDDSQFASWFNFA